jgi:hypothetical protein
MKLSTLSKGAWLSLAALLCAGTALLPTQAAAPDCRTAALPDGTPAMFCKDKKGNWKQQEGKVEVAAVATPASTIPLKAEGKYQGTYELVAKIPPKKRRVRGLGDVLNAGIDEALNTKTERESGGISVKLTFDGPSVTADITGSTLKAGQLVGLVKNGNCVLNNPDGGNWFVRYEGPCGPNGFSGKITGKTERDLNYTGTFETSVISFTDNSKRDAERAALQKRCDEGSNAACVELDQK